MATLCASSSLTKKPFEDDPPPEPVQIHAGPARVPVARPEPPGPHPKRGRVSRSSQQPANPPQRTLDPESSAGAELFRTGHQVGIPRRRCLALSAPLYGIDKPVEVERPPAAASSSVRSGVVILNPSYSQTSLGGSSARWSPYARRRAGMRKLFGTVRGGRPPGWPVAEVVYGERRLMRDDRSAPAPRATTSQGCRSRRLVPLRRGGKARGPPSASCPDLNGTSGPGRSSRSTEPERP